MCARLFRCVCMCQLWMKGYLKCIKVKAFLNVFFLSSSLRRRYVDFMTSLTEHTVDWMGTGIDIKMTTQWQWIQTYTVIIHSLLFSRILSYFAKANKMIIVYFKRTTKKSVFFLLMNIMRHMVCHTFLRSLFSFYNVINQQENKGKIEKTKIKGKIKCKQ